MGFRAQDSARLAQERGQAQTLRSRRAVTLNVPENHASRTGLAGWLALCFEVAPSG